MKNNHITHSINSSLLEQILGHFWVFVQLIQLFLKNFLNSIGDGECWLVLLCYVSQKEKKLAKVTFIVTALRIMMVMDQSSLNTCKG